MIENKLYTRFAEAGLVEALSDNPVVLLHGPRQSGKTTLARMAGEPRGYTYFSFDDPLTLAAAEEDPVGFVLDLPDKTILDEVQRVPELFASIKTSVDRDRKAGRFLLTGSANVLLVPRLSDSLAGRMEIQRLHPLAQCELEQSNTRFLDILFSGRFKTDRQERLGVNLAKRVVEGGYPAALARSSVRRLQSWHRNYIETLVQRDVREMARIRSLDTMPRLLALAASQTGRLICVSDLSNPFQLSRTTIHDYITLLERAFLIEQLPPWHNNRLKRLVKTPKLHMGDTGIACSLLGVDDEALTEDRSLFGQMVETFIYQELRRMASWLDEDLRFYHFRDRDGVEVDLVIERGARSVAGIEVKLGATVRSSDFRGLRKLSSATGSRFVGGIILYDGEALVPFGDNLFAIPIRKLWEL